MSDPSVCSIPRSVCTARSGLNWRRLKSERLLESWETGENPRPAPNRNDRPSLRSDRNQGEPVVRSPERGPRGLRRDGQAGVGDHRVWAYASRTGVGVEGWRARRCRGRRRAAASRTLLPLHLGPRSMFKAEAPRPPDPARHVTVAAASRDPGRRRGRDVGEPFTANASRWVKSRGGEGVNSQPALTAPPSCARHALVESSRW